MQSKTKKYQKDKLEFIKNPSVLEFLGLPGNTGYSEAVLEKAIINHLQQFILELERTCITHQEGNLRMTKVMLG